MTNLALAAFRLRVDAAFCAAIFEGVGGSDADNPADKPSETNLASFRRIRSWRNSSYSDNFPPPVLLMLLFLLLLLDLMESSSSEDEVELADEDDCDEGGGGGGFTALTLSKKVRGGTTEKSLSLSPLSLSSREGGGR